MTRLCFSGFELDLAEPMLCRNGREVRVRPQSLAVLVYLARKPGEIVTSEELITNCWERPRETNVNSVAQCIADIRTALGGGKPQIIRTVPRKGYVFAAPVAPVVAKAERVGADPATQGTEFALSDGGGQPRQSIRRLCVRTITSWVCVARGALLRL